MPDFVRKLRSRVGHQLLWLPGATVVIYRTKPRWQVLLGQRADFGYWDLVAGMVEPGELPEQTLVREAKEEVGVEIAIERLLRVEVSDVITYPNGDQCQFLTHVHTARWVAGEPRICDDESLAVGWFDPDDLPSPLHARVSVLIDLARSG